MIKEVKFNKYIIKNIAIVVLSALMLFMLLKKIPH